MQIRVPVTRQYRNVLSFLLLIFRIFNKERRYREKLKHKAKKFAEYYVQSKSENKPAICILSPEEMGKNAVATYIPTDNVLTVNSAYFTTKNLAELQKPFACLLTVN